IGATDRPVLAVVMDEPVLVLADHHVRIDQRATPKTARHERIEPAERPRVEHPVQALARVPEVLRERVGTAWEGTGRIRLAALEHAHAPACLREAVGRYRPSEP